MADYYSHYSEEQRAYIYKIMRMMRFMNSLGNTLSPKSRTKETSAACVIENHDYSRKRQGAKENKDHANVAAHPPIIFMILLAAGLLLHKMIPLGILNNPGILIRAFGILLIITALLIQMQTVMLMLRKKTALRPNQETTTIITSGFFKYSRNPLYLTLMMIFCGIGIYNNLLWLLILLPVLLISLDRAVVCREERYLEKKFGEEYLHYKSKVRRWL